MNEANTWSSNGSLPTLTGSVSGLMMSHKFNNRKDQDGQAEDWTTNSGEQFVSTGSVRFGSTISPKLIIKLPVVDFVKELCAALKDASDQALRPKPQMGFNPGYSRAIDLSELLQSLEKGEKKLNLVADSSAGFNPLSNISRAIALNCSGIVRSLRKELICGKADPAHPDQEEIGNLITMLDGTFFRLQSERINLEDIVVKIAVQQSVPQDFQEAG